jgi:thiamine pyrophosphokinase
MSGTGIALVVANGTLPEIHLLSSLLSHGPFVLAADGGADKLLEIGIIPDAVLGDFDSVSADLPQSIVRLPAPDQNFTDLDKSIAYLQGEGYGTIWLTGVTGNRLDHTYGALSVLVKYGQTVDIALIDSIGSARLIDEMYSANLPVGTTLSLLPLGDVSGITTTGLQWNLTDETLSPGIRDGISNKTIAADVTITVKAGPLIVYIHHS